MPTRNTEVLKEIIQILELPDPQEALARLEHAYGHKLLIVAGDTAAVARHAEQLRLAITSAECAVVLDHLKVEITIDQAEETINRLYPGRFLEPG